MRRYDLNDISSDHVLPNETGNCSSYGDFSGGNDIARRPSATRTASDNIGGSPDSGLHYSGRHHGRHRDCELFNKDFFIFDRIMIQVCLLEEACNKNVLDDTNVGVMFVSDHDAFAIKPY